MKRILALMTLAVVGLAACMESQQSSIKFADSHVYRDFLEGLDERGVKYRKDKDHLVFYSASDENKVHDISAKLFKKYYPGCGASFTDKAEMKLVERELKDQGIPFATVELDYGPTITCSPDHRDALDQILRSCKTMAKSKKS
jgi:hypothetical protein